MGKGYSPEQIVRKLRQAEGKLANGSTIPEEKGGDPRTEKPSSSPSVGLLRL
jgi:hypothetical protein